MVLPDLAFPYSEDSGNEGDFSCKEEIGDAGGFPNPKPYAGASLDLDDHPSFEEDEAGSSQWPPREKMWRWIVDKWRPSEHRSPLVEGGLRSLIKNRGSSLARDGAAGMHEDRFGMG